MDGAPISEVRTMELGARDTNSRVKWGCAWSGAAGISAQLRRSLCVRTALTGDDRGSDTQRLVSQTMGRPFVAEGGLGLERKTGGLVVLWNGPHLPYP